MVIHNDKFKKGSNLESKLEIKKLIRSGEFETSQASTASEQFSRQCKRHANEANGRWVL